jgi:hypothetical protein
VDVLRQQARQPVSQQETGAREEFNESLAVVQENPSALIDGQEVRTQSGEPQ